MCRVFNGKVLNMFKCSIVGNHREKKVTGERDNRVKFISDLPRQEGHLSSMRQEEGDVR